MTSKQGVIVVLRTIFLGVLILSMTHGLTVNAQPWASTSWTDGHATFYGGTDASGTMGGSCGYGNLYSTGYGTSTTALSVALFNNGLSCGACFELQCITSQASSCYSGASITVTATNECPNGSSGGWCDQPKLHFDLAYPMFTTLAPEEVGVIPIQFQRVSCSKSGGIVFQINGNTYWFLVLITNVGGGGDIDGVQIKGDNSDWTVMTQNWGQNWQSDTPSLVGQALSFQCTLGNGQSQGFYDVAPSNWGFGQSYQSSNNF